MFSHQINDAGRVIVVHLAAKAAEIDFFCVHGLCPVAKGLLDIELTLNNIYRQASTARFTVF